MATLTEGCQLIVYNYKKLEKKMRYREEKIYREKGEAKDT